ncbi:TRAP transporter small permease [Acidisoma silvae]|uniref:TRAP transporter small permease protein n=1 Tax=Acidisoma silvae TaxID=2802396 RepID=A0A963YUG5_9PROT|nr:TRAP transporter small permease subunit [Acidisoma silvae]MCB8876777.1 TRAP transporter small permease subunit [Acidisoma silvae]
MIWLRRLSGFLGCIALLVMVANTLLAVAARYFGMTGFEWSYEVAGIAFIWVTFLGTVLAETKGENAAFTVLRDALAPWLASALTRAADVAIGLIGLTLLLSSIAMLQRSAFVPTPLLRWPGFVQSGAAPVLGVGLMLIALLRVFRRTAIQRSAKA